MDHAPLGRPNQVSYNTHMAARPASYGRPRRDPLWVKASLAVAVALLQKIAFTDLEAAPGSVRQ
jgi:hypothetical protein